MSKAEQPDAATTHFGGEKAKDLSAAPTALPDQYANGVGRDLSGEDIVAAEFGGMDNDLFDINDVSREDGAETAGARVGPEDETREALGGEPSAAQAVKEEARLRLSRDGGPSDGD